MSAIFIVVIISLIIRQQNAEKISFGSTSGCDSACQKECIEVINKYRLNHRAKKILFSQFLADKAQRWADGGTFGYDMKSRGKYGQLIEWDVKNELQNFTTVIKHWHDKERDFDFASSQSKTGKTLHDFTQIVWKKAGKAGCAQSEIFGSKYYVVWMDSDGVVNPNMQAGEENIGSPKEDDLHWYESSSDVNKEPEPKQLKPSRLREETSSTGEFVEPGKSKSSGTKRNGFREPNKRVGAADLNEVQEEEKVLNNNAILKQYLFQDSLNKIVLNENKETASYRVVPGAKDDANWQKGAESLIRLDKSKPKSSSKKQNDDMATVPAEAEDDRKEAAKFQSLVIQDDDMLTKDEEDYNGTLSSQGNNGEEFGADENNQAAAIQSMMKQEDDMIQNQDDEGDEEYSGNTSKVKGFQTNSTVSSNLGGNSTTFYASGVALNKNRNETASNKLSENLHSEPVGGTSNSSVGEHEMKNQSINDSFTNGILNSGGDKSKPGDRDNATSTALLQNDNLVDQQVLNKSQAIVKEENRHKGDFGATNGGGTVEAGSSSAALTSQNGVHTERKPGISGMTSQQKSQSLTQLNDEVKTEKKENRQGKMYPTSQAKAIYVQPQQTVKTVSTISDKESPDMPNSSLQSSQTTGKTTAAPLTKTSSSTDLGSSVTDVHHVMSPALIKLPSSNSRPIKLVFHVKDMNSKSKAEYGSTVVSDYQTPITADDITAYMNDDAECQDDTLQCHLWAQHGHCKGIAYAEFMKRHCKATCGYCGLPSVIKESAKIKQPSNQLTQDEPCEDSPTYEFSCQRWQAQGYCERRQMEMNVVCRKTCGFCEPAEKTSRASSSSHPSTSSSQLHYKENSKKQAPMNSKQPITFLSKLNLNELLKAEEKLSPSVGLQSLISVSSKTPQKPFVGENNQGPPKLSSLKAVRPIGRLMLNQSVNLPKNLNESRVVSSHELDNKTMTWTDMKFTKTGYKEKSGWKISDKSFPTQFATQSDVSANFPNDIKMKDQLRQNASRLPTAQDQGVTDKAGKFMLAPPVKMNLPSSSGFKPQVTSPSLWLKTFPSQQLISQNEDKVIENGIKALQRKLQAPLEISAVAKSIPGCGRRLCKERPNTQQAKTRETIGNRVLDAMTESKINGPVSTKGCDESCQKECLDAHNRYRLNHGASPLVLDQKLANQAQQWADKKVFKHSPWAGGQGGETIALGSLYPSFTAAVKAWHDEEKDYDWSTGEGLGGMKVNHFTQVVWKGAHLLGCGKTFVNGEPYYIAQMDIPGVITGEPGFDRLNVGKPKEPDLHWFMDSSPYWKEMQTKDSIPKNIEHLILK